MITRNGSTRSTRNQEFEDSEVKPIVSTPPQLSFSEFDRLLPRHIGRQSQRIPVRSNSFADFMDYSKTLRTLVLLGVQLHEIERKHPDNLNFIVNLELSEIKPKIEFLVQHGIPYARVGHILTKCPNILDPARRIENFEEVLSYLMDKGFKNDEIHAFINRLPMVLTMPVDNLDGILGYYQKLPSSKGENLIKFSNAELKSITLRCPMLIKGNLNMVYERVRTLEISCGFTLRQIRKLFFVNPWILLKDGKQLELLYKFYSREMSLSNDEMVDFPWAFGTRIQRVIERHEYLKKCGKAQYKRDQPGYVSLQDFYELSDESFCEKFRLGTTGDFKIFIKSI